MIETIHWNEKQEWRRFRYGTAPCGVVVTHWTIEEAVSSLLGYQDGGHRWNIYAYVYPGHKLFEDMKAQQVNSMFHPLTTDLPLHGGPSAFEECHGDVSDRSIITAYKIGCDYNHSWDTDHTFHAKEHVESYKSDGNQLFEYLTEYGQPKKEVTGE